LAAAARVVSFPSLHRAHAIFDIITVAATALLGYFLMAFLLGAGQPDGNPAARSGFDGATTGRWLVLLLVLMLAEAVAVWLSEPVSPILGFEAAFSLAAAWVLHCCGYRFVWRSPLPE
jgi:hypothetical protein